MLAITDLLNQGESNQCGLLPLSRSQPDLRFRLNNSAPQPNVHIPSRVLCSKVHPRALKNHKTINFALRRKSSNKRTLNPDSFDLKLHLRSLEAGLRVRLLLCPSVYEVYNQLLPISLQKSVFFTLYTMTL